MKFEEVLPLMREGKKARMQSDIENGAYWVCGYQHFKGFPDAKDRVIIKIEKDGTHLSDKFSWGIPRWAIMAEDWEIFE